jgi:hypothetical protein
VHAYLYAHAGSGVCNCAHVPPWYSRELIAINLQHNKHCVRTAVSGVYCLSVQFAKSIPTGRRSHDCIAFLMLHCTLPGLTRLCKHVLSNQQLNAHVISLHFCRLHCTPHVCSMSSLPQQLNAHVISLHFCRLHYTPHVCSMSSLPQQLNAHMISLHFCRLHCTLHVCTMSSLLQQLNAHVISLHFCRLHYTPHVCSMSSLPQQLNAHMISLHFCRLHCTPHVCSMSSLPQRVNIRIGVGQRHLNLVLGDRRSRTWRQLLLLPLRRARACRCRHVNVATRAVARPYWQASAVWRGHVRIPSTSTCKQRRDSKICSFLRALASPV